MSILFTAGKRDNIPNIIKLRKIYESNNIYSAQGTQEFKKWGGGKFVNRTNSAELEKLTALTKIKQSILQKAFTDEL